jgi:signal transduction histidine kinase
MYRTTVKDKQIWHEVVTNKTKGGELYYIDSYIKADFDDNSEVQGFMSIGYDVTDVINSTQEIHKNIEEINKKNTYLEHAAKILRHDMHSGINTYMPRGISSLERRLNPEIIKELKIESPLKMIKEGLAHTQKVYKGVYEFTNLVKKDAELNKDSNDLRQILIDYLGSTSYISQVAIDYLPIIEVNQALFCTAIDNLIRNGLKYNDSESKMVAIFMEDEEHIAIQDNGRGMTQVEFEYLSQPYTRKDGQKETGTGLGLNICVAILEEHGFKLSCEKNETGTKMRIKIK